MFEITYSIDQMRNNFAFFYWLSSTEEWKYVFDKQDIREFKQEAREILTALEFAANDIYN